MLLTLSAEEPGCGYSLQKRLQAASGGLDQPLAGTLDPQLHRLESEQLVSSHWEVSTGRRPKYAPQGPRWTAFIEFLRPSGATVARGDAVRVAAGEIETRAASLGMPDPGAIVTAARVGCARRGGMLALRAALRRGSVAAG